MKRLLLVACLAVAGVAIAQTPSAAKSVPPARYWYAVQGVPGIWAYFVLLLTDGTLMFHDAGTENWWKLTPDEFGRYATGTWTQRAPTPPGYSPLYFASAVLPDGRVLVEGGEYIAFNPVWSTDGAIYDPVADSWQRVNPPAGWASIGDAQSVVLANGKFMLADCCTTNAALFDAKTLTWTQIDTSTKVTINDEEGWTLLPNGNVLTIDASNYGDPTHAEIYVAPRGKTPGKWISGGSTGVQLADLDYREVGPAILRPNGTVFAVGATGHNAIYDTSNGVWSAGPDFRIAPGEGQPPCNGQLDSADGPAALLPNGGVLVIASPCVYDLPAHYFEFDGATLTEVAPHPSAAYDSSYNNCMLVLPTGEILVADFGPDVEIYVPKGAGLKRSWGPEINSVPTILQPGGSYVLKGERLNGVSQGSAFGDDLQNATNYPLVRITNRATHHVFYARTHDHSSMAVNGGESFTHFDVPKLKIKGVRDSGGSELGVSDLVVIANGVPSESVPVIINP
jgi:hypothetical protein